AARRRSSFPTRRSSDLTVGDAKSGTSHVAIAPNGKLALVTRDGDDRISVLSIDGTRVEYTKRDVYAGLRPYPIDIAASGAFAARSEEHTSELQSRGHLV